MARPRGVFPAVFSDLGGETSYGYFSVLKGADTDARSFSLNPASIADANAASGYLAIGAAIAGGSSGFIFSGSNAEPGNGGAGFTQRLVITTDAIVPETPATVGMLLVAPAALGFLRRKFVHA